MLACLLACLLAYLLACLFARLPACLPTLQTRLLWQRRLLKRRDLLKKQPFLLHGGAFQTRASRKARKSANMLASTRNKATNAPMKLQCSGDGARPTGLQQWRWRARGNWRAGQDTSASWFPTSRKCRKGRNGQHSGAGRCRKRSNKSEYPRLSRSDPGRAGTMTEVWANIRGDHGSP